MQVNGVGEANPIEQEGIGNVQCAEEQGVRDHDNAGQGQGVVDHGNG